MVVWSRRRQIAQVMGPAKSDLYLKRAFRNERLEVWSVIRTSEWRQDEG